MGALLSSDGYVCLRRSRCDDEKEIIECRLFGLASPPRADPVMMRMMKRAEMAGLKAMVVAVKRSARGQRPHGGTGTTWLRLCGMGFGGGIDIIHAASEAATEFIRQRLWRQAPRIIFK